ncbi:hypothetical protein SUGI_0878530 [Cryptomeria japonica]|uniref:protein NRT1/ PTR FAMILY 5.7 n=1 Tax=Cryptomeria japonica TaxID=3369 RepID=UPI002414B4D6|nr:protein NRT1/ PTR FAMILY 5.7 [Cryptomeria japonica]GLJ42406.1 hypothetical protein SUGI_0878530 [Cryptomeria japonica]
MGFFCWREWFEFWKKPAVSREDGEEWVNDGSVDLRGRSVMKSKSGGWKASLFIIGVEFSERLTYYGVASNLIIYLTTVLHEGVATSAKNVNNWSGVTTVMPLVGGFLADAYFGRYWMVLISSVIYLLGLVLLTLSASLTALKPPQCDKANLTCNPHSTSTQVGIFFFALYLISIGTGGHKPSLQAFGADQFNEQDSTEKLKKISFFNWWYFGLCGGVLVAVTVVVYVQDNIGWGIGFSIPTAAMAVTLILFLFGTPYYRNRIPRGSPLTRILQVFVAAIRNRNQKNPEVGLLYEKLDLEDIRSGQRLLSHTENLKFLDKAAIVVQTDADGAGNTRSKEPNPWKVCTITQVEETKLIIRMVPIWLCCLTYGVAIAQGTTFFIKQGYTMDRRMGSHFLIPPASLLTFTAGSMVIFVAIYDRFLVPIARKFTGNERGISILQRIGVGMFFSILFLICAALSEKKRVNAAKSHGLLDTPKATVPLSVFWLSPQFILLGIADVFTLVGLQEYFYDQVPDNMRSLGIAFYLSVVGVASFISSLLITITGKASERGGHGGWFVNNLNRCHLDYFYWLLASLSAVNLCLYIYIARKYTYKKVKPIEENSIHQSAVHTNKT